MSTNTLRSVAVLCILLAGTGCQHHPAPPPDHGLALKVEMLDGGPRPAASLRLPRFTMYGDGTVITPSGMDGAIPTAREYRLTREAYERIYQRARSAGLDTAHDYNAQAPDAPVWIVTFVVGSTRTRTRIVAPDPRTAGDAGATVRAIESIVSDLPNRDLTAKPAPYFASRVAVNSSRSNTPTEPDTPFWPIPPLGTGAALNGGNCTIYSGALLDKAMKSARASTAGGLWLSNGRSYRLYFRPLLPDESSCDALGN